MGIVSAQWMLSSFGWRDSVEVTKGEYIWRRGVAYEGAKGKSELVYYCVDLGVHS